MIELKGILATVLKKNNKKLFLSLLPILLIMGVLSFYAWSTPQTTTVQLVNTTSNIETVYNYKATFTPNILYPKGGTVEVGNTIFKKITTAIPFDIKTFIHSEEEVLAKGTYEVQLMIKAGEMWHRTFPLQNEQHFEQKGKEITIIDNVYKIDMTQIGTFITKVEEETGIRQAQYDLEIVPTINGVIHYSNMEKAIEVQDKLIFHYLSDEIKLASEKDFITSVPFNESQTTMNPFSFLGLSLPLNPVRIISTSLFIVLLLSIIFSYRYLDTRRVKPVKTEVERLNKKYGSRIIKILHHINYVGKTVVSLDSFKSLLKISDEKEQPIFFHEVDNDLTQLYLIVDGVYVYTYQPHITDSPEVKNMESENEKVYVIS